MFLTYEKDEGYIVFSTEDADEIEVGDILSAPAWHPAGEGEWKTVRNLTRGGEAYICLENWSMSREAADGLIWRLNSPTEVSYLKK